MGTLNDKLNYLAGTKAAIKTAITGKGVTVADNDTFRSYAEKISVIETGVDTSDATAGAPQPLRLSVGSRRTPDSPSISVST